MSQGSESKIKREQIETRLERQAMAFAFCLLLPSVMKLRFFSVVNYIHPIRRIKRCVAPQSNWPDGKFLYQIPYEGREFRHGR